MELTTQTVMESAEGLAMLHASWTYDRGGSLSVGLSTEVVRRQPDDSWLFLIDEPRTPEAGMHAYTLDDGMQAFWLRLTPPLATVPDAAEIVVTGPATRARATVPVHPAGS